MRNNRFLQITPRIVSVVHFFLLSWPQRFNWKNKSMKGQTQKVKLCFPLPYYDYLSKKLRVTKHCWLCVYGIQILHTLYIYIYIYIYTHTQSRFYTHTHTHIYVYIYICIFRQHFFVNANFIKHNRHFMPTYFLLDPFEFPYYFYRIRGELI